MKFEVTLTGVTHRISDAGDEADGKRRATIQLYDGDQPIDGATIVRPLPPAVASRAQVGDRWTISLQREVKL